MAEGLNRVMLLGNLGADPELRSTSGGRAVLNMRLATTESYLDRDRVRRERTDWHNVVVWGNRGEALAKILVKGSSLFVEGSLRTSSYEDRDGNKRYKTEVIASNVILAGRGRGSAGAGAGGAGAGGAGAGDYGGGGGGGSGASYGGGGDASRGSAPRTYGSDRGPGADRGAGSGAQPADDYAGDYGGGDGDYGGGGGDDDIPF
jgi:single-strand DNA-binding protein